VKATLVLLPLLGITYMLFFVNPGEDEVSRVVFIYFNSFLESFQVQLPSPCSAQLPALEGPGLHLLKGDSPGRGMKALRLGEAGQPHWVGLHPHKPLTVPCCSPPTSPGLLRVCVLLFPQQ
jgi:hypothetical protein